MEGNMLVLTLAELDDFQSQLGMPTTDLINRVIEVCDEMDLDAGGRAEAIVNTAGALMFALLDMFDVEHRSSIADSVMHDISITMSRLLEENNG